MRLYHLSKTRIGKLIPRIPKSDYEDQRTPRICFAKTIQGCLIGNNESNGAVGDRRHYLYAMKKRTS